MDKPVKMLVTYRPKKGKADELKALVMKHGPMLRKTGLIADDPVQLFSAEDKRSGDGYFVEIFSWRNDKSSAIAHQTPEVMSVWEPMGPLLETITLATLDELAEA